MGYVFYYQFDNSEVVSMTYSQSEVIDADIVFSIPINYLAGQKMLLQFKQ
jgi:uncharacterized ferredoxin-like protein